MHTRGAAAVAALSCLLASACGGITIQTDPVQRETQQTPVEQHSPTTPAGAGTVTDYATSEPTPVTVTVTAPATSNPAPTTRASGLSAKSCPGNTLEGCFTYAEMQPYIDSVIPMIDQFLKDQYQAMPPPDHIYYVDAGLTGETECQKSDGTPEPYDSLSFFYCPPEKAVYTGQDTLWQFYRSMGDAAPAVGIAHEYGHHIQHVAGVPAPTTAPEGVNYENQADCISGAWAGYVNTQGVLEEDDISDIEALIRDIAESENNPDRAHGAVQERADAFIAGFRGGLAACNAFYPDVPVIE